MTVSCQIEGRKVICSGVLAFDTVSSIESQLRSVVEIEEVDLTAVEKIDSAGVALLAWIANNGGKSEAPLLLTGLSAHYHQLFSVAEMLPLFRFAS